MTITVPGWSRHRLKFSTEINRSSLPDSTDPDFEFDYVDISRVSLGVIDAEPQPTVFSTSPSRARRLANPGDTIVSTVRTYLRAVAEVAESEVPQVFSTGFAVIAGKPETLYPRFLTYFLQSAPFVERVMADSVGVSYPAINASDIAAYDFWAPSVEQQQTIADFLDRETAQIDAMIEAQEELVKALTARRALSITNAVSFGLDSAGLQDTGVPWLGQAPAHWEVRPLKHLGRAIIGLTYAPENIVDERDDSTLVLRAGNIQGGRLDYGDCVFVDAAIPRIKRLRDRDLLICTRNGSARLIGKSALIHGRAVGQTWGAFMAVFRSTVNDYLYWVLNSALFERQLGLFATSTINQLTTEMLHNMRIAVPPRDEQVRIITHIETAVAKVDDVLREAERTVSLLRERREALISAAVTGRIDPTTGIERIDPTTEREAS